MDLVLTRYRESTYFTAQSEDDLLEATTNILRKEAELQFHDYLARLFGEPSVDLSRVSLSKAPTEMNSTAKPSNLAALIQKRTVKQTKNADRLEMLGFNAVQEQELEDEPFESPFD